MTDARFPERWLNDRRFVRLPDAPFRLYSMALMWSVANRTDGLIEGEDDLDLIRTGWNEKDVEALVREGLWYESSQGDSWLIVDFEDTQTSRHDLDVLDNARRRERDKKRRQRASRVGAVPGDKRGDSTRTGQDKDRTGALEVTGDELDPASISPELNAGLALVGDDMPCDLCPTKPSRTNSAGARLCATCAPHLFYPRRTA